MHVLMHVLVLPFVLCVFHLFTYDPITNWSTRLIILCDGGSGVQRLLYARGQRGSWMPSKIFSIRLATFLTNFFSHLLSKFVTFPISCHISRKFAPWMPLQCCNIPR